MLVGIGSFGRSSQANLRSLHSQYMERYSYKIIRDFDWSQLRIGLICAAYSGDFQFRRLCLYVFHEG